jgi:hypothetical protein
MRVRGGVCADQHTTSLRRRPAVAVHYHHGQCARLLTAHRGRTVYVAADGPAFSGADHHQPCFAGGVHQHGARISDLSDLVNLEARGQEREHAGRESSRVLTPCRVRWHVGDGEATPLGDCLIHGSGLGPVRSGRPVHSDDDRASYRAP